jgi:3-phenylpropionate/trans-cinnamate dioxygenase ferredoxin subunit
MNDTWIEVCGSGDIEKEDVIRFDHDGRTFAIYRTADDSYHATDGLCTHGYVHLSGGVRHGSHYRMSEAQRAI